MPALGSTAGVPLSCLKSSRTAAISSSVAVPSASAFIRTWNSADSGSALDDKTAAKRDRHSHNELITKRLPTSTIYKGNSQ